MTDKLRKAVQAALWLLDHGDSVSPDKPTHKALRAALAEPESEPVKIPHVHQWVTTGAMKHGQFRCIYCGAWGEEDRPSSSERTYTLAEVPRWIPCSERTPESGKLVLAWVASEGAYFTFWASADEWGIFDCDNVPAIVTDRKSVV